MKTIKELEADEKIPFIWANGYNKCRKDVLGLIDEMKSIPKVLREELKERIER